MSSRLCKLFSPPHLSSKLTRMRVQPPRCVSGCRCRPRVAHVSAPLSQRAAAKRAAATAKFHRKVVMPDPSLLDVVVGKKAETVTSISESTGVSIVINFKKG